MKKLIDSDWSRAVQLLCNSVQKKCNSVQKFVISCNYNFKANTPSKCSFYDNDGSMNCQYMHELSRCHCQVLLFHRHCFIIFFNNKLYYHKIIYSFNMELIFALVYFKVFQIAFALTGSHNFDSF